MNLGQFLFGGGETNSGFLGALFGDFPVLPEPPRSTGRTLALRVMPIYGRLQPNTPFIVMMEELEERFGAVHRSSYVAIREIHVSLFADNRKTFEETLDNHGYRIIEETRL